MVHQLSQMYHINARYVFPGAGLYQLNPDLYEKIFEDVFDAPAVFCVFVGVAQVPSPLRNAVLVAVVAAGTNPAVPLAAVVAPL